MNDDSFKIIFMHAFNMQEFVWKVCIVDSKKIHQEWFKGQK